MPAKIVSGPSTTGNSTTQTSDVHHNAVPAGATVLGSSGVKPTTANGMPFFTPTVPVHIDQAGQAYFYVNNVWIRPNGSVAA